MLLGFATCLLTSVGTLGVYSLIRGLQSRGVRYPLKSEEPRKEAHEDRRRRRNWTYR